MPDPARNPLAAPIPGAISSGHDSDRHCERTYNHTWRLDPIVRSLLDTDFYKLLMLQMIWELYPDQQATFSVINRTPMCASPRSSTRANCAPSSITPAPSASAKKELIWLAGNTFYGKTQMFSPDFIHWLADFRLPEYELRKVDGQYELHFHGPWTHTTMWEIPALAILNELRSRAAMKGHGRFALDVLYARAKAKLWTKVERLRKLEDLRLSDFGTRRRHGFLWQRWCVEAVKEGLGPSFTGTSNVLLAMDNDLEAIGTNAHELPMVAAALANDDEELRWAPYRILDQWRQTYGGNLLIALPDAFGTEAFLRDAPDWVADWTGFRPDSAPPIAGRRGDHQLVEAEGPRPQGKAAGLLRRAWTSTRSRRPITTSPAGCGISFGWGTNLTNDFVGCAPDGSVDLDPISLVCKVTSVDGRPAVKLSDNPEKATGMPGRDRALSARLRRCRPRPYPCRGVTNFTRGRRLSPPSLIPETISVSVSAFPTRAELRTCLSFRGRLAGFRHHVRAVFDVFEHPLGLFAIARRDFLQLRGHRKRVTGHGLALLDAVDQIGAHRLDLFCGRLIFAKNGFRRQLADS